MIDGARTRGRALERHRRRWFKFGHVTDVHIPVGVLATGQIQPRDRALLAFRHKTEMPNQRVDLPFRFYCADFNALNASDRMLARHCSRPSWRVWERIQSDELQAL